MLNEEIELLRFIIKTIVENTVDTILTVGGALVRMYVLFITGVQDAGSMTVVITALMLSFIGYFLYKFLWASAKTIVIFFILIVILFFFGILMI